MERLPDPSRRHAHPRCPRYGYVIRLVQNYVQGKLKREAAESQVEEQASAVEAVRAENAAALAKLAENEARAGALRDAVCGLRGAHDAQVCFAPAGRHCGATDTCTCVPLASKHVTPSCAMCTDSRCM